MNADNGEANIRGQSRKAGAEPDQIRELRDRIKGHAITSGEKAEVLLILSACADEIEDLRHRLDLLKMIIEPRPE